MKKKQTIVIAKSDEDAVFKLNLNEEDVIKVIKEIIPSSEKFSLANQAILLGSIYSASLSGQSVNEVILNTVQSLYPKGVIKDKAELLVQSGLPVSEILKELKFNTVVIRLIDSGEVSGMLSSGILEAERYLELDRSVIEISQGGVAAAVPFIVIGLGILLFFPTILGEVVDNLIGPTKGNFFTDIITFLYLNLTETIIGIVAAIITIVIIKLFYWKMVKNIYPFSLFEDLILLKNAIVFLSIYSTLDRNGIEVRKILKTYEKVNPEVAKNLLFYIDKGESLSFAIANSEFPSDWAKTASSIMEFENLDVKNKAIESLFSLLKRQITKQAEKTSNFVSSVGKAILIFAIAMILVGFYFPAMTSQL